MTNTDDIGLVYYLLDATRLAQRVKIGRTVNLRQRLVSLRTQMVANQTPLVLAVEAGGAVTERRRHEEFASLRLGGEWFHYVGPLRDWIASLPNPWAFIQDDPSLWAYARGMGITPDVNCTKYGEPDLECIDLQDSSEDELGAHGIDLDRLEF